jgi:hypothetical protein
MLVQLKVDFRIAVDHGKHWLAKDETHIFVIQIFKLEHEMRAMNLGEMRLLPRNWGGGI